MVACMKKPIVFMYSGQGSHYYQMGRDLFDGNETFKKWMLKADHLFQSITNISIISQLYDDKHSKSQPFTQTLLTHPAIFMVEYALTQVMYEKNIMPDIILGASMGEFAAATAAGIIDFETALRMVIKQAQVLESSPAAGMLAILQNPNLYETQAFLNNNFTLAAVNFSSHFVVSGSLKNIDCLIKKLDGMHITFQTIPVSTGFHSPLIDSSKIAFLENTETFQPKKPHRRYFSCMRADYMQPLSPSHFWDAIRKPILFQQSIQLLENEQPLIYIDLGPSGTLATFIKYNLSPSSKSIQLPILTLFGNAIKNLDIIQEAVRNNY